MTEGLSIRAWKDHFHPPKSTIVAWGAPLAPFVSFRIGGPADALVKVPSRADLLHVLAFAGAHGLPLTILGTGTNVLIGDFGVRGIVVRLVGEFETIQETPMFEGSSLYVGASVLNATLVAACYERGLVGLEFLASIPGTLGGALIMNAGAHGSEIGSFVEWIDVLEPSLEFRVRPAEDAGFAYRQSGFEPGEIVLGASLQLSQGDIHTAKERLAFIRAERRRTQPSGHHAGCIFKNPKGDHAGRLIDACGLKGRTIGGAQISPLHANFIVNVGGALARDVVALASEAQVEVQRRFGVSLEWEVKRVGDFGEVA